MFFSKFTSPEQPYAGALRQNTRTAATTGTAERWEKRAAPRSATSATTGNFENRSISTGSQFFWQCQLKVATVLQQAMRELSEAVSE
jgi:hypothetical protein